MRSIRSAFVLPLAALLAGGCASTDSGEAATGLRGDAGVAGRTAETATATAGSYDTVAGRSPQYDKGEFITFVRDGRLWVFETTSAGLPEFVRTGEPAKSITVIGAGPAGMSMRSDEDATIDGYLAAKPGFRTVIDDGRIWVFREGSEALAEFERVGEPAKSVTLIGAGPRRRTVRSGDRDTIHEWMGAKPGFVVAGDEGRLWVLEEGTEALEEFRRFGEPAKSFTMVGAGPRGVTVRSVDRDTILRWMGTTPGFDVFAEDGRLWVFESGSAASLEFQRVGEPAESVTRIGVGPAGTTVRSESPEVLNRFLRSLG